MMSEDAKKIIYNQWQAFLEDNIDYAGISEAYKMAMKALEQQLILDKIRAEILDEAEYAYADFDQYKEDILHAEPDELPDDDFRYGLERAVEIINKYKAESDKESDNTSR